VAALSQRARARAHALIRARRIGAAVEAVDPGAIPDAMTFREWCEDLGRKGLQIDRKPFRLDNRPALLPIYDAIPTTRAEAAGRTLVVMKATQLGLTVWETLADIYMAKKWAPVNIGLYMPDASTAQFKSNHRFMPIVRSSPLLYRELVTRPQGEGSGRGHAEGSVMTRQFGQSLLLFMWTSGKLSTESRPMDVVSLDEVQGMSLEAIDKVRARTGDSDVRFTLLLSTANVADMDIHAWYQRGTQEVWHTECAACGALSDLSDPGGVFPEKSISWTEDGYVWSCPACGERIEDPQRGRYVASNPEAAATGVRSFLLPRTISPRITPGEMISDWRHARTGDQRKSFYNRTLARPYVDQDQLPVTLAHCQAAADEGMRLGLVWEKEARPATSYYMGIDQMGGWHAIVVKKRLPDGRFGVVHTEGFWGEGDDAWAHADALMERYRVAVCVLEQLPNADPARAFANRHPGRVFLATYGGTSTGMGEMLRWADQTDRSERRTDRMLHERFMVHLDQYKAMQMALYRVRDRQTLFPDPDVPEQVVHDARGARRVKFVRDWYFDHLTKTALVVDASPKTAQGKDSGVRKPRAYVQKVALDPHMSFANMLCDVACARQHGTGSIYIPSDPPARTQEADAAARAHGQQAAVAAIEAVVAKADAVVVPSEGTCGRCTAFSKATLRCSERGFQTTAEEPACPLYVALRR
jgi:Phage terminase large subunit (GpA)